LVEEGEGKETGEGGGGKEKQEWNLSVVNCTIFRRRASFFVKEIYCAEYIQ